jgi:hypothetical protein
MIRALILAGGVAGAAGLSQFPEYSQQYNQRLAGAVDELSRVVADFDASAAAEGLSREAALAQMVGTPFVERRQADMRRSFDRHARLSADLSALQNAGPFMRAYHAARLTDREIAARAWGDFRPALPLDFAGILFGLAGFVMGGGVTAFVLALARWPLRRRVAA